MNTVSRRSAMTGAVAGSLAIGTAILGRGATGEEQQFVKLWTLEGELKVHPKYIYRYYLQFGDGQKCALYGSDHEREPDRLERLQLPARVRVRGVLGTAYHPGGTKENPSPFGPTWELFMDVHEADVVH
jgi:hypothetical protein